MKDKRVYTRVSEGLFISPSCMTQYTGFDYEKGIRLLVQKMPTGQKKPVLYHSLRVGAYLFYQGCSYQLQIAGLLHDAIEDTDITYEDICETFDEHIAGIVLASSKNNDLPKGKVLEDVVKRCSAHSEGAMIVKVCDIYDNFKYYLSINNEAELGRCRELATLVNEYRLPEYQDGVFALCDEIINRCSDK